MSRPTCSTRHAGRDNGGNIADPLNPPPVLHGKRICLRPVEPADVTAAYCQWLNDPRVNRYLESRFQAATEATVLHFVRSVSADPNACLFGIRLKETDQHIGNIKLGPIETHHRRSEIGILIGETGFWGRGYASEAVGVVVRFAFGTLGLHKLTAGCYASNKGSVELFKKCGFDVDGIRKAHCFDRGRYVDAILFGLFNKSGTD